MKLGVSKNNEPQTIVDLGQEVLGSSGATFFIGRSRDCHIHIDDRKLSREHASITFDGQEWSIELLATMGEMQINGLLMHEKKLVHGDSIIIGEILISVDLNGSDISNSRDTSNENINDEGTRTELFQNETLEEKEIDTVDETPLEVEETSEEDNLGDEILEDDQEHFSDEEVSYEESEFPEENDGLDEFENSEYEIEEFDDEKTQVIKGFAQVELDLFGENAPYDKYKVTTKEVFIGRDPSKCQIILNDGEVSAVHAVLRKNNIFCTLEDLNSGNGTLLNGKRINKENLTNNDEFIIGDTTFTVNIESDFLNQEEKRLMPVEQNQMVEVEEIVEVSGDFEGDEVAGDFSGEAEEKSIIKRIWKNPEKRKKAIYVLFGLVLLWVLFEDDSGPVKKRKKGSAKKIEKNIGKGKKSFSKDEIEQLNPLYNLAHELTKSGKYIEALTYLNQIFLVTGKDREYKNSKQLYNIAKQGLEKLEEIEAKRRAEEERKRRELRVKELVKRARKATKERKASLAEKLFSEIKALDPENFDVSQFELDLKAWEEERKRAALKEAEKKAERDRQIGLLAPGKKAFIKKDWYKAIKRLEQFMGLKGIDEDLNKEGSGMLSKSRKKLEDILGPLKGKARSLREGQDLKGAYEHYQKMLKYDPTNTEALNEMDGIQDQLTHLARISYREAIISEDLSLFDDAKEKFLEVMQIAPTDNEYYKKAKEKLKNFLY